MKAPKLLAKQSQLSQVYRDDLFDGKELNSVGMNVSVRAFGC